MTTFILSLIASVIFLCVFFFFLGKSCAYGKVIKKTPSMQEAKSDKDDCSMGIAVGAYVGAVALFVLITAGVGSLKDDSIDKWRSNEIIEQVNYKYHRINGKQTIVDSTFNYIKNTDFEK